MKYYVISLKQYEVPDGDEPASITIEGKRYKKDTIFVANRLDKDSTTIYTFSPNQKVWIRNTGVEEAFWQLANIGNEPVAYKKITKEFAYKLADEMRNYSIPVAKILIAIHRETSLPY